MRSRELGVALALKEVLQQPAMAQLVLAALIEMRDKQVDSGHVGMGVLVRYLGPADCHMIFRSACRERGVIADEMRHSSNMPHRARLRLL